PARDCFACARQTIWVFVRKKLTGVAPVSSASSTRRGRLLDFFPPSSDKASRATTISPLFSSGLNPPANPELMHRSGFSFSKAESTAVGPFQPTPVRHTSSLRSSILLLYQTSEPARRLPRTLSLRLKAWRRRHGANSASTANVTNTLIRTS